MGALKALKMPGTVHCNMEARPVWTSDLDTMARDTALHRWPKIVQGMIEDFEESLNGASDDSEAKKEGLNILTALVKMKEDIASNAPLV